MKIEAPLSCAERLDRLPLKPFHFLLFAIIYLGLAFDHMDQVVLSFVIPEYGAEWGISSRLASINPATGLAATFLGALFWGMVADRIGRKPVLILTLLIFAVTSGINGFAWSFPQLVVTCIIMGVGVGGAIPIAFILLAEYTPAKYRGMTMVVLGILALVGGYLIASGGALFLLDTVGWRSLFFVGLAPILLIPFYAWLVPESPRFCLACGRREEAERIVASLEARAGVPRLAYVSDNPGRASPLSPEDSQASAEGGLSWRSLGTLWKGSYRSRTLMLWVYSAAFGFFTFGFLTWLPTLLKQGGLTSSQVHLYTTIMALVAIPSALVTAFLFFRWSTKGILALYPFIAGVAMVLLSFLVLSHNLSAPLIIPVGAVIFFFGTVLLGVFGPYSTEVYPTGIRGTGSGWAMGMSRFGAWTAIPLGGAILGAAVPLFVHQLIFGLPLFVAALVMLAWGIETRGKRLEEIV